MALFRKGEGGRPKGAKNKAPLVFKQAVLRTYEGIGGDEAFCVWAMNNQTDFYKIAGKLIPQEVAMTSEMKPLVIDLVTPKDIQAKREADADGQ